MDNTIQEWINENDVIDVQFLPNQYYKKASGLVSQKIENSHLTRETVLAAIELLIPYEFSNRMAHISNVEGITSFRIAEYFKVH
ncbi:hypothetical protein BHECKSOX2_592 [Bathymodiolus heckerae thiotrophic gill symbiont]|uniref:hypothetical protein n=1 Tax=Bathymodiolus heckerae thiotrophic gill symbiont TaxID=1052212 RepID=UPI0010B549B8|nr:hypothetical protein [Bathymodiolus heckerae thiotrophic gill symbiont]SMN13529.1 hypothetical protein BHECKSOX2_592 [Bathymodiolus heckerae thiotrophic gill symbiont]